MCIRDRAYGVLNPLFEAPDEHWHFFTAESIAQTGRLPRVEAPPDEWLGQEAAQPPLYYPVSYTHLDVYKRQAKHRREQHRSRAHLRSELPALLAE